MNPIKKIILVTILLLLPIICLCQSGTDDCPPEPPPVGPPGGDNADDNFSFASGSIMASVFSHDDADNYIFQYGYCDEAFDLLSVDTWRITSFHGKDYLDTGNQNQSVVIIPSGGFYEKENDEILKNILKKFVSEGGTLVVFAQQHGDHVDQVVPVPVGEHLKSFGWREDQSCARDSSITDTFHPALSSLVKQRADVGVDGYFERYPSNATVLLRKAVNHAPVLITYPYGEGTVILTTMFTDWAHAHSQATQTEINLVRDIFSYAVNPKMPIPMYNVSADSTPEITRTVSIANTTEQTATKVKIFVMNPNRTASVYETEQSLSLPPGEETSLNVTFTHPGVNENTLGIWHVEYQLYTTESGSDIPLQMTVESPSGRFALYLPPLPDPTQKKVLMWMTTDNEFVYWDQRPTITIHIKNNTDGIMKEGHLRHNWWHNTSTTVNVPGTVVLEPGQETTVTVTPQLAAIWNSAESMEGFWGHLNYKDGNDKTHFVKASKGIRVLFPMTKSSLIVGGSGGGSGSGSRTIAFGTPINYSINIANHTGIAVNNVSSGSSRSIGIESCISVVSGSYYNEQTLHTLHSASPTLAAGGAYNHSADYAGTGITKPGIYRMKLEVTRPDDNRSVSYSSFAYKRSNVYLDIDDAPYYWTPGAQLPITVHLTNQDDMIINQGHVTIKAVSKKTNTIAFSKDVENITFSGAETLSFTENFIFNPTVIDDYELSVTYSDETRTPELETTLQRNHYYRLDARIHMDKSRYYYQDLADVMLEIHGSGALNVEFNCAAAGIGEEFTINLPPETPYYSKHYSIPLTIPAAYAVSFKVTDTAGNTVERSHAPIPVTILAIHGWGRGDELEAVAGNTLHYRLNICEASGTPNPVSGTVSLSCPGLGFSDTRPAVIAPGGGVNASQFLYDIPIPESTAAGTYRLDAQFLINGTDYLKENYPFEVTIPGFRLELPDPPQQAAAGQNLVMTYQNTGGRTGTFALEWQLSENGIPVLTHKEQLEITAGESKQITIPLPAGLKTGTYQVYQSGYHSLSGTSFQKTRQMSLTGTGVTLATSTTKDTFFNDEIVSGGSDITLTGDALINGNLQARIVRYHQSGGIHYQAPGDYVSYNFIESGFTADGKLYLSTDKGLTVYNSIDGGTENISGIDPENFIRMRLDTDGSLWLATTGNGVYKHAADGNVTHYTTADGLGANYVYDILFADYQGNPAIWVGTTGGLSILPTGASQFQSFTTSDGLPSNSIRRLAKDTNGRVWISTGSGTALYDANGFSAAPSPLTGLRLNTNLTSTSDGAIWAIASGTLYQIQDDTHNQWQLTDIYPPYNLSISQVEAIGSNVWLKGTAYIPGSESHTVLIQYDGGFNVHTDTDIPGLKGLAYTPLIPSSGNDAYFKTQLGLIRYNDHKWENIRLQRDSDKLSSAILCLTADNNGKLWAGTAYGISMYDGTRWTNYCTGPDNFILYNITSISSSPDQSIVYGLYTGGIAAIEDGTVTVIPFDQDISFNYTNHSRLAVDNAGRIWVGSGDLFYYNGEWHKTGRFSWIDCITGDNGDGVWVGGTPAGDTIFHLQHLTLPPQSNQFNVQDYISTTSGMFGEKDLLYLDRDGILWTKNNSTSGSTTPYQINNLQSYDGTRWMDYSAYEGFPENGVLDFIKDDSGRFWIIGADGHLYSLKESRFFLEKENIGYGTGLTTVNDILYCGGAGATGGEPQPGETGTGDEGGLIILSSESGISEEDVWSQVYTVDLQDGTASHIDLLTGQNLPAGSYRLKSILSSSSGQLLAQSIHPFSVREKGVSILLSQVNAVSRYINANEPVTLNLDIQNNGVSNYPSLYYRIKKYSAGGSTEIIADGNLSLSPGGTFTDTIQLNEIDTGTWELTAELVIVSGGGEEPPPSEGDTEIVPDEHTVTEEVNDTEGTTDTILSTSQLLLEVCRASVKIEPPTAQLQGDTPFNLPIKLVNNGHLPVTVEALITVTSTITTSDPPTGGDTPAENSTGIIHQIVSMLPGQEHILTVTDCFSDTSTTGDSTAVPETVLRQYTITLSGDVEQSSTFQVHYGYTSTFKIIAASPLNFREGTISIPYEIINLGGLAFSTDIRFRLYRQGNTAPLVDTVKSHNIFPSGEALTDTFDTTASPGDYLLKYLTSRGHTGEIPFTVHASGIGVLNIDSSSLRLSTGQNRLAYNLTNTDTVAGHFQVRFHIRSVDGTSLLDTTRSHYLTAGQTLADSLEYNFTQRGVYSLDITGEKLTAPVQAEVTVLPPVEIASTLTVGALTTEDIPINLALTNSGYLDFTGSVITTCAGITSEDLVTILSGGQHTGIIHLPSSALSTGTHMVNARLCNQTGDVVATASGQVTVTGPVLTLQPPQTEPEVDAGGFVEIPLKLKNEGHLRGEAELHLTAFDAFSRRFPIALDPGQEIDITGIIIDAASDLPSGSYPLHYNLIGTGVANGINSGNFNIKVNGISLSVDACLDKSHYNEGETAQLTLAVSSTAPIDAVLEVVVNRGDFNETRSFQLTGGTATLFFDIPVAGSNDAKIFYGIYHENGKGIHLNDIYLYSGAGIRVETDRQVYPPGDVVYIVFNSEEEGSLIVTAFDEKQTFSLNGTASAQFVVPENIQGGTYGLAWTFIPASDSVHPLSGNHPFDVAGLVVKMVESRLLQGKYAPGDTIQAAYTFESNQNESLQMKHWIITPSNNWEFLGEKTVTLSSQQHVDATAAYDFTTTEAGTHYLACGLYRDDQLMVSGRSAFHVGDAVLMGITTDKSQYTGGNENINVAVDYFGQGSAQLELFLGESVIATQTLNMDGTGTVNLSIAADKVTGGTHLLEAIVNKNGLISKKWIQFTYGTHLPDLSISGNHGQWNGLNYSRTFTITNNGKTASIATILSVTDNGSSAGDLPIPALQPDESYEVQFIWNGKGKAGEHAFIAEVDRDQLVKEFYENNNKYEFSENVPILFYDLELESTVWKADSDITIITRLLDNSGSVTPLNFSLTLTNQTTLEEILNLNSSVELSPFSSKAISDHFNTGIHPAGEYLLHQTLNNPTTGLDMEKEIAVSIETTKRLTASLTLQPISIPADKDSDVELTMNLENKGNVPIDQEALVYEVFNKETEEIVKTGEFPISLDLAQQDTLSETIAINLMEGNYALRLSFLDNIIATTDLTVVGGIETSKTLDIRPRVLIMDLQPGSKSHQGKKNDKNNGKHNGNGNPGSCLQYLSVLLQSQDILFETAHGTLDSFLKLQQNHHNLVIVLGNPQSWGLRKQLIERVWSGEGLLLFPDKSLLNPDWLNTFGMKPKPLPGNRRERNIRILASTLSGGGEIQLSDNTRLHLDIKREEVVPLAQTLQGKHTVTALCKYGNGYILVSTIPPDAASGSGHMPQLLLNALQSFSNDVYSHTDLSRVLPIVLSLKNESPVEKTITVKEILPYGVDAYNYQPQPETDDELKWQLTIPATGETRLTYWLKLPDQVDTYEIKTEIFDGDRQLEDASLSYDVSTAVLARIDELIQELGGIEVNGKEGREVKKAVHDLRRIRNNNNERLLIIVMNTLAATDAAYRLGKVNSVDVSAQRLKINAVMRIMGRRLFDKLKTLGASPLMPFYGEITAGE